MRYLELKYQKNMPPIQVEDAYVNALTIGDLSSLKWVEGPFKYKL